MLQFRFKVLFIILFVSSYGIAQEIRSIEIKGNRKIEADAIIESIESQKGSSLDRSKIRRDIQEIFNMGYFYDVKVFRNNVAGGVALTYEVLEKPSIVEIYFNNNVDIDDEELREATGIKTYSILNTNQIQEALEKMQKLYEDKGFFLANISYELKEIDSQGDRLALHFNIQENDKVSVKSIHLVGNTKIPDSVLKGRMATQEGGLFSFISSSGNFKQELFERDLQAITYSYFNEGYVQVKVEKPQVSVTPDKKSILISIFIEEGKQYNVGSVDFSGDLLFTQEDLNDFVDIDESEIFVYETLQKDLQALQAKYGDLGYAFANIIPRTKINEEKQEVDITFDIDKGQKAYFGKINVVGNTKTRDKVVRRELFIFEGELYNETKKRESLANVRRLGFFDEVNFRTSTPPGQPQILDIDIVVKERNTGSIQVGAGYSSFQRFILNAQINQTNLFGRGQRLGLTINYSELDSRFNFSFTEPFFLDTPWSVGTDFFYTSRNTLNFVENRIGVALRLGHPIAKYLNTFVRYKLDETNIDLDDNNGDPDLFPVETVDGITSSVTTTLVYDQRDDRLVPKDGVFGSFSFEYAGLGGDNKFLKTIANARYYKKVFWELVWRNNITYGNIQTLDDERGVPFNELFLLGGANTLRGFRFFQVGKRKFSVLRGEERPFGGEQQLFYNLEFEFPLITEAGIRGVSFYDIGFADDSLEFDEFRSNYGFGFRWFSPIGPLRFEWGFPVDRQRELGEAPFNFEFAIGTPF